MLQRLDTGPHSVHMRLLPQEFAMEGVHFHIILLILLYFFVAGVVLVLHGLDAGSHSVHMGLLPQELILEGLNFHIILFYFAFFSLLGECWCSRDWMLDASGCQWLLPTHTSRGQSGHHIMQKRQRIMQ